MLIFAVSRSLGLETKVRPILLSQSEEACCDRDSSKDELHSGYEYAAEWYKRARKRVRGFQNDGFHILPYSKKQRQLSSEWFEFTTDGGDESLDSILSPHRPIILRNSPWRSNTLLL